MNIEIALTPTEKLIWEYAETDYKFLIESQITGRINQARDAIVSIAIERYLAEGIQIPASKDEIVEDAYARGWIKSAIETSQEERATTSAG